MKALDTRYAGRLFRSRIEARWAVFFDLCGIRWEYEEHGFELSNGERYLPDFFLPEKKLFFEVKGADPDDSELLKCELLAKQSGHSVALFAGHMERYWVSHHDETAEELLSEFLCQWLSPRFEEARRIAREVRFEHGESTTRYKPLSDRVLRPDCVPTASRTSANVRREPGLEDRLIEHLLWAIERDSSDDLRILRESCAEEFFLKEHCKSLFLLLTRQGQGLEAIVRQLKLEGNHEAADWIRTLQAEPQPLSRKDLLATVAALRDRAWREYRRSLQRELADALERNDTKSADELLMQISAARPEFLKLHPIQQGITT